MKSFFLLILITSMLSTTVYAQLFRWVDANGKVHYSDKLSGDAVTQGHAELNQLGTTLRSSKSNTQRLEEERKAKQAAQEKQRLAKQEQKDRYLLNSYVDVVELVSVYEKRLELHKSNLRQLRLVRAKVATQLQKFEDSQDVKTDKKKLESFMKTTKESLKFYDDAIEQGLEEIVDLKVRYKTDKQRLEALLNERDEG